MDFMKMKTSEGVGALVNPLVLSEGGTRVKNKTFIEIFFLF
jgi:hypothetical protein